MKLGLKRSLWQTARTMRTQEQTAQEGCDVPSEATVERLYRAREHTHPCCGHLRAKQKHDLSLLCHYFSNNYSVVRTRVLIKRLALIPSKWKAARHFRWPRTRWGKTSQTWREQGERKLGTSNSIWKTPLCMCSLGPSSNRKIPTKALRGPKSHVLPITSFIIFRGSPSQT